MHSNNFNILSQTSVTSVFSPKYIIFWPIDFFSWLKKTHSEKCLSKFLFKDNYRIRTARSQKSSFILFKLISCSLKKRIKGRRFSDRLIEFHSLLNIAINYYPKSIFWWNVVENQKLQTLIFKRMCYTLCGYSVLLNFV